MRFSFSTKNFTSAIFIILSLTSTILAAPPASDPAKNLSSCEVCLNRTSALQVPACAGLPDGPTHNDGSFDYSKFSNEQKACLCQLSLNGAWIKACASQADCGAERAKLISEEYVKVNAVTCPAGDVKSPAVAAGTKVGGSGATVGLTAVTVAVVFVLL
ncbi:MAG: hypothetical protein J3R72DRAFT_479663 [Linnemannia gamsii]|nr:MAG: hypothetical protein J3R72DRAFT_479663 [Linnemannia gamsii]